MKGAVNTWLQVPAPPTSLFRQMVYTARCEKVVRGLIRPDRQVLTAVIHIGGTEPGRRPGVSTIGAGEHAAPGRRIKPVGGRTRNYSSPSDWCGPVDSRLRR